MTTFHYRAFNHLGDMLEGEVEASTVEEAESLLFRRGLTTIDIKVVGEQKSNLLTHVSFGKKKPSAAQIAAFTREFATLEEADVPLDQSLRILSTQSASPVLRDLAQAILNRIIDGVSLSEALSNWPDIFNREYINVVREGEAIGKVGLALTNLAEMLERQIELRGRIQSALVYPALLIVLALVSTGVVVGTLVPSIAPIFADNGRPMPSGLQFILDAEENSSIIVSAAFFLIIILIFLRKYSQKQPAFLIAIDHFYLKIPVIGVLLAQFSTARFANTLGSMLKAGVPLLQALESGRSAVINHYINSELSGVIEDVRSGSHLSSSLNKIDHFPPVAIQMISIGEETGKLDVMLLRVANMFERQTQRSIERVMGLLTPVLTILIAAVVGLLIMTVMDAVLGINELAGK